jgi:imidazolonepropionase-like amidohydrolase
MRELGIIEDGAVLIADGKIAAVGTTDEVAKHELARKADEIDCSHNVVLPGFVDSHTHPVFTGPRLIDFEKRIAGASYEEIAEAGGGIRASLRGVRDASLQKLAEHVCKAWGEMAAQGTTTVEAKSGYGLSFAAEMKSLEAIREALRQWPGTVVPTLLGAHVVPPEYRDNPEEYVRIVCEEMIPAVASSQANRRSLDSRPPDPKRVGEEKPALDHPTTRKAGASWGPRARDDNNKDGLDGAAEATLQEESSRAAAALGLAAGVSPRSGGKTREPRSGGTGLDVVHEAAPPQSSVRLAEFVDVFCERGAFSIEQSRRILRAAVEHNLGVRAHVCQLSPAKLAALLEFQPASLDHMDFVSDEDIPLLAKLDTVATLLPAANYFLGLGTFPPARKLIDSGVPVALATDYNPGTSPTPSMPFVLSAACTHMQMSPAQAIVAATFNGACALRLQGRKGSLEPGKDADIAVFDASDYRELAYWFGVNCCRETYMNGIALG